MSVRPIFLALISLFVLTQTAFAQAQPPAQPQPAAPTVTVTVTSAGVRFAALGAVRQTRLEVYDSSGARVFDSDFQPGNVRDWAAGADGAYSCVLSARDLAGRVSVKQAEVVVEDGRAALSLGAAEAAGGVAAQAPDEGPGAATLATHDGRDGAVTATTGALTFRTGDLLAGAEQEHVRVTPEGRVGIGTTAPEATLDVAGTVRAQGGFRFSDGSTLDSSGGRLTLTTVEGETAPAAAATGTGTQGRLAKWLETGGAGTLGDSIITETEAGNIGVSNPSPTTKLSVLGAPGAELRFDKGAQSITPVLNVISQPASTTLGGAAGLAAGGGGTSFNFSDNLPFFIVRDTKANVVGNNLGFGTPLFTVQPNGNVGVGTTSPTSKLQVAGPVSFTGLRTEENATSPNVVGGFSGNGVTAGVAGATVGGGGVNSGGNRVTDNFGTVGGGRNNRAGDNAGTVTDGGFATVGGGFNNIASGPTSTVSGGNQNTASNDNSTVGGGSINSASGESSTVGGGFANTASGQSSTVPGGSANAATGSSSFAAGQRARANHAGAFVWGDSTTPFGNFFASTAPDQFLIRASGGVGVGTNAPQAPLHVFGVTSAVTSPVAAVESGGSQAPLAFRLIPSGEAAPAEAARLRADNLGNLVFATLAGSSRNIFLRAGDDTGTDLFIQSSTGNVGVGTTSPNRLLHVNGRARVADIPPEASVGSVCFNAPGDLLQCGASSLRWKTDVAPFAGGLSVVNRLRPIAFTWKRGGARDIGLGAEEVERVAPQFTFANEAGEVEGVKYDRLPVLLISAVHEQQRQIAQLRRAVAALQRQNARLSGLRTRAATRAAGRAAGGQFTRRVIVPRRRR